MEYAAPSPPEEDTGSFWTGYCFKSEDKEEKYLKRYENLMVRAVQMWGISRLLFDGALPCSYIGRGHSMEFFIAYVPAIVITIASCFVVTFLPRY